MLHFKKLGVLDILNDGNKKLWSLLGGNEFFNGILLDLINFELILILRTSVAFQSNIPTFDHS